MVLLSSDFFHYGRNEGRGEEGREIEELSLLLKQKRKRAIKGNVDFARL